MVLDFEVDTELLVILAEGADAVGTDGEHLLGTNGLNGFDVLIGQGLEDEVIAQAAGGVARAALFFQHAESNVVVAEDLNQGGDDFPSRGIVAAHATEPEQILLRAIVDGQFGGLDEAVALEGREAHGVAVTFEI